MYNKRVKVIGGVREKLDDNKTGPFVVKKVVVVEDRHLGALFRRDEYLRSLVCRLEDTTEALTPGLFFSELISK
jgi:hypothetical protein